MKIERNKAFCQFGLCWQVEKWKNWGSILLIFGTYESFKIDMEIFCNTLLVYKIYLSRYNISIEQI
jgi:hypothetical protein